MFTDEEKILENLIVGRVEPHIYAFSTNSIPNYLKIGDTYRPVAERLLEWKKYYPELNKEFDAVARVKDVFFRDFAVHKFLENDLKKIRLLKNSEDFSGENLYYSKEFFKNTDVDDINNAISDIKKDYTNKTNKYSFYNIETLKEEPVHYLRGDDWALRDNQKTAVDNFKKALDNGRTNLLMYAVMRFGKSFTSLCCAKEIENLKLIIVVSAKADVREEWKKNTEIPGNFSNFEFKTSRDLLENEHLISEHLANSNNKVVVLFLTLQDLQGDLIKEKHKELFSKKTNIDLLIIDETHFGARAEKYGSVLKQSAKAINKHDQDEFNDITDCNEKIDKMLKAKYKLHLSGTPYRILMGSEFQKEDIISFCQYSDIFEEQDKWNKDHLLKDVNDKNESVNEWDNPYFGFPQMIRFAFNPNEASRKKLKQFAKEGNKYALSKLLEPKSTTKDNINNNHKKFIYETEILELLEVIDGSKNDNEILSFLDYDKIKHGKMCRHIVMVLPYCASCDAMEHLITTNVIKFKNLKDYKIINISGIDNQNQYKDTNAVKKAISDCEKENIKTVTLTVNRMLTGSTVEQWDTMIFLKDTSSPQEYDQAVFRLQSQYIKTYKDKDGDIIKYNMKPQTLLVDFCIDRIFKMQELKSQIYNVNTDEAGNKKLKERIEKELQISPIIVINSNKIRKVTAKNILDKISEYSKNKGVAEETNEIPVDLNLKNIFEIWNVISKENELGSKKGFNIEAVEGDSDNIDIPDSSSEKENSDNSFTNELSKDSQIKDNQNSNGKDPVKQFRMYYSRILYYSFLTSSNVYSLDDIILSLNTVDNSRIFNNMGLNKAVLVALKNNMNKFMLSSLDYKIQNINKLSHDVSIDTLKRADIANQKFGKLGESEVVTPKEITTDMIALLPDDFLENCVKNKIPILDIASKEGEFAIALYERFTNIGYELDDFKDLVYSIPTSSITYEFTRKIYEVLGLNKKNIAEKFNSYDLLKIKNGNDIDYEKIKVLVEQNIDFNEITLQEKLQTGGDENMVKFGAVVGNPPYQEDDGGAQKSARPIYHHFVRIAKVLASHFSTLIIPSRWFAGGKGLDEFREEMLNDTKIQQLDDFFHPEDVFPDTNNRGGVCFFLRNKFYDNIRDKVKVISHINSSKKDISIRDLRTKDLNIFIRSQMAVNILNKVIPNDDILTMNAYISPRKPFGIESNIINSSDWKTDEDDLNEPIRILGKGNKLGYIERNNIIANLEWIEIWKVFIPRANNIGTELNDDNLNTYIGEPNTICTEAHLLVGINLNLNKNSVSNLSKYLKTKFARFMHSLAKSSHDASRITYRFVPLQEFSDKSDINWDKTLSEIDKQLYKKYNLTETEISYIESMIKPME